MKKIFVILIFLATNCQIIPALAQNQSITLDPYIIDEKVNARDILEYNIKITNNSDKKVTLYAIINDITPDGGKVEFKESAQLDKSVSVARWAEFSRQVIEIEPKKVASLPLRIKVSMYATPGKRYATIAFSDAINRYDAESSANYVNLPKTAINLDVVEETVEKAEKVKFGTVQSVMFQQPIKLSLEIKNIGNTEIIPEGEIRIYDRRGVEIGNLNINKDKSAVKSLENFIYENFWSDKKGFGKYKAELHIEYGVKATRDIQDVIYFWILPWQFVAGFGVLIFLLFVFLAIALRKSKPKSAKLPIAVTGELKTMDVIVNKK